MNEIVVGRSGSDREKLGTKGTILLGKHYIKMGRTSNLSNEVLLDVNTSHVVFICGKRGGGKCLTGDTLIVRGDGSLKAIKDLKKDDFTILSLDKGLKISQKEKENFYERKVDSILKLTLKSGRELKLTPEHPLLTYFGWEPAYDLNVGSKIATPKIIPVFGEFDEPEQLVKAAAYFYTPRKYFLSRHMNKEVEEARFYFNKFSKEKLSEFVFKLPEHKLALFLNRFFSASATLKKDNNEWSITLKNTNIILTQIQHLLLRFGVVSVKQKNTLVIEPDFVRQYLDKIGFVGDFEKSQKIAFRETARQKEVFEEDLEDFWEFFDPQDWEVLGEAFSEKSSANFNSREMTKTTQKLFVKSIIESDIYWDEIIKVEKIDEQTKVYDITVPETNNFIANDIIVHNSYTMGVIAEGVSDLPEEIKNNISIILLDTMGVYWTMKYKNKEEDALLEKWGLEPKSLDVKIYTPHGFHDEYKEKGIPTDYPFSIRPSELSGRDWNMTFSIKEEDPVGVLINKVIHELQEEGLDYDVDDIVKKISEEKEFEKHTVVAAKNLFLNTASWGLFKKEATKLKDLAMPGQVSVLDVSCYATMSGSWNVKNLVIGLVSDKLFVQRMLFRKEEEFKEVHKSENPFSDDETTKKDYPLVWLVIDEAHEFLPLKGKTLATDPLVTIMREGRQPGISLILATQQPGKIHTDVMTQSDTVIAHRITSKLDTDALGVLMQSYMRKGLVEELDNLPREKGAAVIFDDTNEKMYPIRVRPRFTWHGGSAPNAIKK